MSLHRQSRNEIIGTPAPTHRSQFHIYRIVGDRPPEECVPIAIGAFWRTLSAAMGLEAAERVRLDRISVEPNRILMRILTPVADADEVSQLQATFDDRDWQNALDEIVWKGADADLNRIRRETLDAVRKERRAMRKEEPSGKGIDRRGAMEKVFEIPKNGSAHLELMRSVTALWTTLREKKGADVADSVTLRCIKISRSHGVICAVAPMFMASEIAQSTGMLEHPGSRYVIDGEQWTAPMQELLDLRKEAIRPTNPMMSAMGDLMKSLTWRKTYMAMIEAPEAEAAVPSTVPDAPVDRFTTNADGTTTIAIDGSEPFTFVRKPAQDRDTVLVRLSVGMEWKSATPAHARIIAFVKSVCRDHVDGDTWNLRVIGTLSQPKSESVVMQVPEAMMRTLLSTSSSVRTAEFSAVDLDKLLTEHADRIAILMGCSSGLNGRRLRTEAHKQDVPAKELVANATPSYGDKGSLQRVANGGGRDMSDRGLIGVALFHTWRLVGSTLEFIWDPFRAMERMWLYKQLDDGGSTAGTAIAGPKPRATAWGLLRTVLEDQTARIEAAESHCDEFERVANRWGDAVSADTSASVGALLDRIATELQEIVEFGSPDERTAAGMDTLGTLERLGLRAEEERSRLVQNLRARLDTTRRFVDAKLDDRGLTSVTDIGRAA